MRSLSLAVGAVLALATLTACPKKPETAPEPTVNADSVAKAHAADSAAAAQSAAKMRADSIAKAQTDAAAAMAATQQKAKAALKSEVTNTVYFDFDKSALTDSAKKLLDRKIVILNANPTVGVQIEGHTDERGAAEYNLALGQQRAAAVKRYLTQHGIADARITIISYGEEKPAAPGHDETSWSKNRRAEFVITIGDLSTIP